MVVKLLSSLSFIYWSVIFIHMIVNSDSFPNQTFYKKNIDNVDIIMKKYS